VKLLFVHDHIFQKDETGTYYSSQLPYSVWLRYLAVFDEVIVAGRNKVVKQSNIDNKISVSSGPNVNFIEIPTLSKISELYNNRKTGSRNLMSALTDCDALIARLPSEVGLLAISIAKKLKKPYMVEVVGDVWHALWNYGNWKGKLYAPIATIKTKNAIKTSPFAIYVTENMLQQRYPCNGMTSHASNVQIDNTNINVYHSRITKINNASEPLQIGLIGSLASSVKGVDTALLALAELRGKTPEFEFRVLGSGSSQRWSEMSINLGVDNITHFEGTLAGGIQIFEWLDNIDLYIQPSLTEGLPRALIEAMSRGCPAIGSTAGGIPELLDPANTHKPGDSHSLSKLIEQTLNNKDIQLKSAKRNFEKAMEFSNDLLERRRTDFLRTFVKTIDLNK
jgi:glycosyltransferase involved in cell wall biosynthesis